MPSMSWTAPEVDRASYPDLGDEAAVLGGWLDYQRDTLLHKCAGLTEAQLKTASAEPSNLTLLGLVRHMTELERWFRGLFTGESADDPYSTEGQPDAAFDAVASADARADLALFGAEVELTRKAISLRDLGDTFSEDGQTHNLRTMCVHIIEEYARHNGHADLLRERIDGATGA
jgi:uncharacterized damage-inducible protein DinB